MAQLPEYVVDLLNTGHVVWVATVGADGMPNIAIKGSGALLDNEHIFFADLFSKKTRANLLANSAVAVALHDPDKHVAVQIKGHATLLDAGELFSSVADKIAAKMPALPRVSYVVKIDVESVWDMTAGPHAGDQIA